MQRGNPTELNFEGLEMQNRNMPTDKTQRADEKNGLICLVIMLTPRVMVIKCQKWLFFVFSAVSSNKSVTV